MLSTFNAWRNTAPINVMVLPEAQTYQQAKGQTLLQSAVMSNVALKHRCKVGSCGTCRVRLVSGKVKTLQDVSYTSSAEDITNNIILVCQTTALSDVVLETLN